MSSSSAAPASLLLGRGEELASVLGVVDRVESGAGGVAFIEGEPGIGKSCLLDAVVAEVSRRTVPRGLRRTPVGCQVRRGAASELESDRPFLAIAQALDIGASLSWDAAPSAAGPVREETAAVEVELPRYAEARSRLVETFVSAAERLALDGPVLLALEDLHWADPSTLLTVYHIGRRLAHVPAVVVATLRPSLRTPILDRVVEELTRRGGLHLALGPLDDGSVAELVEREASAPPAPRLLAAAAEAGGNPLYVTELVAALRGDGALRIVDGRADADIRVVPRSFRALVLRQLSALTDATRQVLRVAAALGTSFSLTDLATVLERPATELITAVDEAWRMRLLVERADVLAFRHELVREAIYHDMPEAVRRGLHLQAGRALAAGGGSAATVAPHLARGAAVGDTDAVGWLWRAGAEVGSRAPAVALELCEHALRLAPPGYPHRYAIVADLVDALVWAGRHQEAAARARELLERDTDVGRRNAVRMALTLAMLMTGQVAGAVAEVEAATREFRGDAPDRLRLAAYAAWVRTFAGDPAGGWAAAQEAADRAREVGDLVVRQHASVVTCFAAFLTGDVRAAIEAGRRALDHDGPLATAAHQFAAYMFLGTALLEGDRIEEADRALGEGLRTAEELGLTWQPIYYHAQLGLVRFDSARWDDALAEFEAASVVNEEFTGVPALFAEALSAVIAVHRGRLSLARGHLDRGRRAVAIGQGFGVDTAGWATALYREARGDRGAALAELERAWRLNQELGFRSQCARVALDLCRLARDAGRPALAAVAAAELESLAGLNPTPSRTGLARICRGLAEGDPELLGAGIDAYRASPRGPERAWAYLEAGTALARCGRAEAVAVLVDSADACEEFGAMRDVARADAALRGLGVRRGRRGARNRPATGWESLTRTELDVVRLAVEGLTNAQIGQRLFISGRTVETHFSHIFAKLGVSSRVRVAAMAAARPAPDA